MREKKKALPIMYQRPTEIPITAVGDRDSTNSSGAGE
jgi:hypothetical protein